MILYGTKILSDREFPHDLPHEGAFRSTVSLSCVLPDSLENAITCGMYLYWGHGRDVHLYSDRAIEGNSAGQPWCYEVANVVRFYWRGGDESIYYHLDAEGNTDLLSFWFIHLLLPLYLTLENRYDFIHAGAVEVEGKPILFIAPSMGGKSTMTDYFIQHGHSLITDDKLPTFIEEDKFMVAASHPYHRPYRKFEELGYRVENFTQGFKPIHVIYVLEGSDADTAIMIDEISGFAKFDALLPNYLYMFSHLMTKRLTYLSQMLNSVRMFRVFVPWDRGRLCEVHDVLVEHSRRIV